MKLRLRADTLRLRLTRGEVDKISQGHMVSEQTRFPDGSALSYALVPGQQTAATMAAAGSGQEVRIEVAADAAKSWADSNDVGFSGDEAFVVGGLAVLIEKDFSCITPRSDEEELDTYPNPNA